MANTFSDAIAGNDELSRFYSVYDARFVPIAGSPSNRSKTLYIDPWSNIRPRLYSSDSHISKDWIGSLRVSEGFD